MSEYAFFYNSVNGDRVYGADSFSDWMKQYFTDGVKAGTMQVAAAGGMTVTVAAGAGAIGGKMRVFDAATTLTLDVGSGSANRIDNIVLRRDDTQRNIYLQVVKGSTAANPTAPALVRSGGIYDLKLAEVYVAKGAISVTQANITDTRMNASVCGYVAGAVSQIDFTQISAQFEAYLNEYKTQKLAEFTTWYQNIVNTFGQDAAGALQNEIDALDGRIDTLQGKITYGTTLPSTGSEGDVFILIE